jgi:hypothetical protein
MTAKGKVDTSYPGACTVDVWGGVRVFNRLASPGGFSQLVVSDTSPSAVAHASNLNSEVDAGAYAIGVYVKGGNVAGSGLVAIDAGPGLIGYINDSSILTAAARDAAAAAWLTDQGITERGTFTIDDVTPATVTMGSTFAGSMLAITDAQGGYPTSTQFQTRQITQTFYGAARVWDITYGGMAPSVTRQIRRLTRAVRS